MLFGDEFQKTLIWIYTAGGVKVDEAMQAAGEEPQLQAGPLPPARRARRVRPSHLRGPNEDLALWVRLDKRFDLVLPH